LSAPLEHSMLSAPAPALSLKCSLTDAVEAIAAVPLSEVPSTYHAVVEADADAVAAA
jgi:hypothetical protein